MFEWSGAAWESRGRLGLWCVLGLWCGLGLEGTGCSRWS